MVYRLHCFAKNHYFPYVKYALVKNTIVNTPLYNINKFKFLVVDKNISWMIPLTGWKIVKRQI